MVKVKIRTPYDKLFDEMHETYETCERLRTKLQNMLRDKQNVEMQLGIERSVSEGLRRKNKTLRKAVDQAHDGRTSGEVREDKLTLALDAARAENKALANSLNYQDRLLQEANKERDTWKKQTQSLTVQLQDAHLENYELKRKEHKSLSDLRDDLRVLLDAL